MVGRAYGGIVDVLGNVGRWYRSSRENRNVTVAGTGHTVVPAAAGIGKVEVSRSAVLNASNCLFADHQVVNKTKLVDIH